MIIERETGSLQPAPQQHDPWRIKGARSLGTLRRRGAAQRTRCLQGQTHRPHAEFSSDRDDQGGDGWMNMHVLMGIDMIEVESRRFERRELRADFGGELPSRPRIEEEADPSPHHVAVKQAGVIHEIRNCLRRQDRSPLDQNDVKANGKARQRAGSCDGVTSRRRTHHEAGAGENAVSAGPFDGRVDGFIQSEIVGADDEAPSRQWASSRSRRNWKNSTPSRNRRTIISGLRTISPTIDAILPARK